MVAFAKDKPLDLHACMTSAAFAMRGYDITNLGRSRELMLHPVYGKTVCGLLRNSSEVASDILGRRVNLIAQIGKSEETSLDHYGEAIALILAMELAQVELLDEFFGIRFSDAQLAVGYSLGEVGAIVAANVFPLESVLLPLLSLADDTAALARDVRMGVLFSRGPSLDVASVNKLCVELTSEGNGVIAISTYLSPNTLLLMGQGDTVDRFKSGMKDVLSDLVHLHINQHRWPPIHTPITHQSGIRDRAAVVLASVPGGFTRPSLPLLSCITGGEDYSESNSRQLLTRWVDEPQQLWDVISQMFSRGVQTVIHVGPAPNIFPATLNRLAGNVKDQLNNGSLASFGLRAVSRLVRRPRPWLTGLFSSNAHLLRAPFIRQVVLEDWLLENAPSHDDVSDRMKQRAEVTDSQPG